MQTVEVSAEFERAKDVLESSAGLVALTPPLDGDYWLYRVKLKHGQSIIAFPKFFTIGCGFAQEKADWNTNLPVGCDAEKIYNHIKVNKGHKDITKAECIAAIKAIQVVVEKLPKEAKP